MFQASQMHPEHPKTRNTIDYTSTSITITFAHDLSRKLDFFKTLRLNPATLNILIQSHMHTKLNGQFHVQHGNFYHVLNHALELSLILNVKATIIIWKIRPR